MTTTRGNREEKRKRIMSYFINATIELMEEEGIENLSIRKVADRAWYLDQWRCFCRHSFARPRIYHFLFFSPEGIANLNGIIRRYYEIYPDEKVEMTVEYERFLSEGDFFKRNEMLLRNVVKEREYNISEQEIEEVNEMSVLIYRGVLAIMRCDRDKPTVDDAVNKTVKYLEKALEIYHLDMMSEMKEEKIL